MASEEIVNDADNEGLSLKRIVLENDTRAGRIFDLGIQCLILISIVSFSIETLPDLSSHSRRLLRYVENMTVVLFTVEYILRIILTENRLRFVFSFFGMIDLLAILPFYISTAIDLRSIRAIRLLRLFRILKLARYNRAIERFRVAFQQVREELFIFAAATLFILYISAVGIYHFEREVQPEQFGSVFHSLWWAVATLTTVGYGDVYPVTVGGRVFTGVILLMGVGIVAIPSGLFAAALTAARQAEVGDVEDDDG